jgi:hypothetical protein
VKIKLVLLIVIYLLLSNADAQQQEGLSMVCTKPGKQVWIMGGLNYVFAPEDETQNSRLDSSCQADDFVWVYFLNDMPISVNKLMQLDLSAHHLSNDETRLFNRQQGEGYGTYAYIFKSRTACPDSMICRVETDLPIYVNGQLLDSKHNSLQALAPEKIVSIKSKYMLFRGRRICIELVK